MEDIKQDRIIEISDRLRPIVEEYIYKLNHSTKIRKDMRNAYHEVMMWKDDTTTLAENGHEPDLNLDAPKMGLLAYCSSSDGVEANVYDGDDEIAESVIPVDVLAYRLSQDERVKSINEIKSVKYDNKGNIYFNFKYSLNENSFIVNEAYIGKTPNLIAMEDCFRQLKQIDKSQWGTFDTLDIVDQINTLFEAQFGMDIFSLHLEPDPFPNAWTMPISYKFDYAIDQSIKKNGIYATQRDGFKFKPNNGIAVIATITSGLLFDQSITAEETIGVLLHELGHNFADYIDPTIRQYDNKYILNAYNQMMYYATEAALDKSEVSKEMSNWNDYENAISPKSERRRKKEMSKKEKENKRRYNYYAFRRILSVFSLNIPTAIINLLAIPIVKLSVKRGKEFVARSNEMMADKFATTYGYGPAVQSALTKMTLSGIPIDEKIYNIPLIGAIMKLNSIPGEYLVNIYDEHPNLIARIDDQIYTLQQELTKKNMSKEVRAAIEADLKQLQQLKSDITSKGKNLTEAVQNKWFAYLDNSLDKDEMAKISQRLNEEMDNYIKKI